MFETSQVAFLNAREEAAFCARIDSPKYKFLAYLMLDCGLRVSQAVELRVKDFDFGRRLVKFIPKKKRGKKQVAEIPLTQRIIEIAAEYWKEVTNKEPEAYMFPAINASAEKPHLCRKQVWRYFHSKANVHPHMLRHTCATKLIESGQDIQTVRNILCHSDSRITEIYVHASEQRKRAAINSLEKTNIFQRIKQRLFPSKAIHILPLSYGETDFHIGRKQELERLADLTDKRVNILVMGSQGIGKSHLLDNFTLEKILRIDDCKEFRKTLAGMIVKLCNEDKEEVARLLNLNTDVVTKESQKRLIEILCSITDKQEYTLIFDDVSKLTPTAVTALEKLRGHFHIIAAARSVEVKNATWLTNFEKIELKPLNRLESIELIERVAENFKGQIEDFEAFKNHIFNSTNGIPQFIIEMVQRYQKEKFVRADAVLTINHTAARGEISAVPFLFLLIGCLVILKFWGREAMPDDKEAFMLIGGGALVVLMFGRFAFSKRKFV